MITKVYPAETKALKNGDVQSVISTEAIDRVGDTIIAKGWEIDNYIKTGAPVLFSHSYDTPPIGKSVDIRIQGKSLVSITHFHEKTQLSRDLAILARDGDMRSWSVGFNPTREPTSRTENGIFKGYVYDGTELLEYSLVAVPANPEAVSKIIHAAQKGRISDYTARIFAESMPQTDGDDSGLAEVARYFEQRAIVESMRRF